MCGDCQRRAETNPLRVLDCKVPKRPADHRRAAVHSGSSVRAVPHALRRGEAVSRRIAASSIEVRPRMVRGLDYYMRTTFEMVHGALGAQNSVLGGGRYDGLAESLGSRVHSPGIGFSIGEDRLVMSVEERARRTAPLRPVHRAAGRRGGAPRGGNGARIAPRAASRWKLVEGKLKRVDGTGQQAGRALRLIVGDNEMAAGKLRAEGYGHRASSRPDADEISRRAIRTATRFESNETIDMETSVPLDFLGELRRTHTCGELRASDEGKTVLLMGWVHRRRDLGGVIFMHLRDREGVTQLVFHADDRRRRCTTRGRDARLRIRDRGGRHGGEAHAGDDQSGDRDRRSGSGRSSKLWILNESRTPPFPMEEEVDVKEDARLKYRYVDLRRPHMQRNIILRSKIAFAVRAVFVWPGLSRNRNAVHDALHARRRARLSGAQPRAAGHLLRAAAIAADFQAAADGQRVREIFPDRALLPRRGSARRPPARVHADRSGDVVPAAGAHLRR